MIGSTKDTLLKTCAITHFFAQTAHNNKRLLCSWWKPMQIENISARLDDKAFILFVLLLSYLVKFSACFFVYFKKEVHVCFCGVLSWHVLFLFLFPFLVWWSDRSLPVVRFKQTPGILQTERTPCAGDRARCIRFPRIFLLKSSLRIHERHYGRLSCYCD